MKLSHYTIRNLSIPLLLILLVWASVFYILIMHEIDDETNDTLENYKELIIRRALTDPDFDRTYTDEMTRYRMKEVSADQANLSEDFFYDSFTYVDIEMEYEPVRILKCYFLDAAGKYYELEIETSTLEKEDMTETIFWSIIVLYVTLLCGILLITHYVFKKSFTPLYGLLNWLRKTHPGKKDEPYVMNTQVDEFVTLNKALLEAAKRNREIYNQQKQFVENAAHELQTPLAIATNKLELLSENPECTEEQLSEIGDIYNVLRGVIRTNKSLLLLSRIENRQYPEVTDLNINEIVHRSLEVFTAIYETRCLQIDINEEGTLSCQMNDSLAGTLVSNLLKNAFVHNYNGGHVSIKIESHILTISNTSHNARLEENDMYRRFNKAGASLESTGLGLAIVKSIALLYEIEVAYQYTGDMHQFRLSFKK
ncbi:HAMP domain-containing sensor histidine kinase [Massilibacteroides sp.]|uniref:sensor histidine kinase n=1 Tax=Massilibacteroides sp. TaxID=2034766 RepID=UPI0026279519|nr:HAMP domain-containing sensor histidine kinase [Massilibacteroides sp.]MDD4514552.1 HAMP domain-containing sensor histidine kinase [Massilibacteroides sp.]